jgi:ketosteroid isomerase-like protein
VADTSVDLANDPAKRPFVAALVPGPRAWHARADGRHHVRPPLLRSGPDEPGDVVARYRAALTAGDPDAVLATFAPDGYLQDPAGARHTGAEALRTFFAGWFDAGGGPAAQTCTTTDDGRRCAVETTYLRWGGHELPPQAGMAVFERAPDGLLAAVRLYDDVEPPAP